MCVSYGIICMLCLFFKQKTADEMRMSDRISDVCSSDLPAASEHHRLVFVDGHHRADLSSVGRLPEGAELTTLRALLAHEPAWVERHLGAVSGAAADDREQPLLALNTAMMMNGFVLRLAEGTVVHEPIEVVHLGGAGDQPLAYHPRNLIVLAPRSQVTLIEHHTHLGPIGAEGQPYYANSGTGGSRAEGAGLHHRPEEHREGKGSVRAV